MYYGRWTDRYDRSWRPLTEREIRWHRRSAAVKRFLKSILCGLFLTALTTAFLYFEYSDMWVYLHPAVATLILITMVVGFLFGLAGILIGLHDLAIFLHAVAHWARAWLKDPSFGPRRKPGCLRFRASAGSGKCPALRRS